MGLVHCAAKKKILLFFIYNFVIIASLERLGNAEEEEGVKETEEEEPNLGIFNDAYLKEIEWSISGGNISAIKARTLLSKLGKIALYNRLYRSSVYSPISGHHGFNQYFPQPPVQFHPQVYDNCSLKRGSDFIHCVDFIFENIQNRAKFMFPLMEMKADEFYHIDEEDFMRRVSNAKFNFDISISYLFCFLTKNQLSVLAFLPFCAYGFEPHQSREWPAIPFRQFADSQELINVNAMDEPLDPIDNLSDQLEFECADVSFCPDPCCGRGINRFFHGGNSSSTSGYCSGASTTCRGRRNLDERDVNRHFSRNKTTSMDSAANVTLPVPQDDVPHACFLEETFNDDFLAIMENRWNLTCACFSSDNSIDIYKMYRFDVHQCVDLDECISEECPEGEQCVNLLDGFKCACPIGEFRGVNQKCASILLPVDLKLDAKIVL